MESRANQTARWARTDAQATPNWSILLERRLTLPVGFPESPSFPTPVAPKILAKARHQESRLRPGAGEAGGGA
jgi:hypothetical protein